MQKGDSSKLGTHDVQDASVLYNTAVLK